MFSLLQEEGGDRKSDPILEEKIQSAKELNEEKRKSARRKEYVRLIITVTLFGNH